MKAKPEIQVKFVTDAITKEITPDMFCRILLGKSEATLIRELQQFGVDRLLKQVAVSTATIEAGAGA